MNSVITYSSAKIKISPLFGKSIIINIDDVVSISIKYRTGGEYAIVKYRNNEKIQKAFTYQHPFDHVTGKTIGVQGLLESGSDWDNIYDLKRIVEQKNGGRY